MGSARHRRGGGGWIILSALGCALWSAQVSAEEACGAFGTPERVGELANAAIDEASGLAASGRHEGLFWVHNDSGDGPFVYLVGADGTQHARLELDGIEARDWEDMAVGPCAPGSESSCLYIGDIGDNPGNREQIEVHRVREPDLPEARRAELVVSDVTTWALRYPEGPRDAEALMVSPLNAELYIVEKRSDGVSEVFAAAHDALMGSGNSPAMLERVGEVTITAGNQFSRMITGGDIHPGGGEWTLRTYTGVYTYCGRVRQVLSEEEPVAVRSPSPPTIQSEAVAYGRGEGDALWITSERVNAPMFRSRRAQPPTEPEDAGVRPDVGSGDPADASERPAPREDDDEGAAEVAAEPAGESSCATTGSAGAIGWVSGALIWARRRRVAL